MNITEKMETLVENSIEKKHPFLSEKDIQEVEREIGVQFDKRLRQFLTEYADCYFKDDYMFTSIDRIPLGHEDGYVNPGYFYGKNILSKYEDYKLILGAGFIPICDLDGGDLLCTKINRSETGEIYYWSHDDTNDEDDSQFFFVAESFEEFIKSFKYNKRDLDIDLSKVKITLDPSLM